MEAIRGNIGREIKYFPHDSVQGKEAAALFSVAEQKFAPPTQGPDGKNVWAEPETVWHDARIGGDQATRFAKNFQAGDAVVLAGSFGKPRSWTDREGVERASRTFFATAYGHDSSLVNVEVDRTPKAEPAREQAQEQTQAQSQSQAQTQAQEQPVSNAQTQADDALAHARNDLNERLNQLVDTGRISGEQRASVAEAFENATSPKEAHKNVSVAAMQNRLPQTETIYLTAVTAELNGQGPAGGWSQAEAETQKREPAPMQETPPQPAQAYGM